MRLKVLLETRRTVRVPLNHQDLLRGVVYRLLGMSDETYARRVHEDGWSEAGEGASPRPLKLFTFSHLRTAKSRRRIEGNYLTIAPGPVEWWIGSPLDDFLQHEVQGMLTAGAALRVGEATFTLASVEAHAPPAFGETARFVCLTPIVASVPSPEGRPTAYFLRPRDGEAFSEAVRKNLLRKYALAYGAPPTEDRLKLAFDEAYLAADAHGGTKKMTLRDTDVVGALAPFTLTGAPDLLRSAWELGLGEKTGSGFGMIDKVG